MRAQLFAVVAVASLTASGAAFADDAKTMAQPAAATNDPDKVICYNMVSEGRILPRGECHTQRQWDRIMHERQNDLMQWQLRALVTPLH